MNKGWLLAVKKEMTKVWIWDKFVAVTLLELVPQDLVRYKTQEKDWYVAMVVGLPKSNLVNWQKEYKKMVEFKISDDLVGKHNIWSTLDSSVLDWIDEFVVMWSAKWKWYQWVMKRFNAQWWPETHGSKFHRHVGSLWNRKPRRVQKWHPHAGHMWWQNVTLKNVKILDIVKWETESLLVVKWSLPWAYNDLLKCVIL